MVPKEAHPPRSETSASSPEARAAPPELGFPTSEGEVPHGAPTTVVPSAVRTSLRTAASLLGERRAVAVAAPPPPPPAARGGVTGDNPPNTFPSAAALATSAYDEAEEEDEGEDTEEEEVEEEEMRLDSPGRTTAK